MSAGLTAAINKGISAAEKLHEIKVSRGHFSNHGAAGGRFLLTVSLPKKNTTRKKFIKDIVGADITAAKEDLKIRVDDFRSTLGGALDEMGNPIFSEERKAELVDAVAEKTANLIAELQGYQKDYDALMTTQRKTPRRIGQINFLKKLVESNCKRSRQYSDYAELALKGKVGSLRCWLGEERQNLKKQRKTLKPSLLRIRKQLTPSKRRART